MLQTTMSIDIDVLIKERQHVQTRHYNTFALCVFVLLCVLMFSK